MSDLNRLNDYLLDAVKIQTLLEFDTRFGNIFKDAFYNGNSEDVSHPRQNEKTTTTKTSIISHFLKHWKSIQNFSGITTTLPTILTGSVVEGSPLARLFHPDMKDEMEIEADVMYVVGSISKDDADDAIQSLRETPGFLWLKKTPNIKLFMTAPLPTLESITEFHEEHNNTCFINGSKLKVMHKALQPSGKQLQRNLDILEDPYEVTINQSTQGPSSEIIFNIRHIVDSSERAKVVNFLQKIRTVLEENITNYKAAMEGLIESEDLVRIRVEWLDATDFRSSLMSSEEKEKMMSELRCDLTERISDCKKFSKQRTNILKALNSLKTILNIDYDLEIAFKMDFFGKINGHLMLFPFVDSIEEEEMKSELTEFQKLKQKYMYTSILTDIREDFNAIRRTNDHFMCILTERISTIMENSEKQKESAIESQALTVSFDNVSCFYCSFWPKIASEWISRERLWPSPEFIDGIVASGSYIVAKSRPGGCENELDWRWSFSTAEIQLAQERTTTMKYCYFLFKSMFYKYFKFKIDDKSLPSYVAKTCMLYVSEMHPSEWWGSLVEKQSLHRPANVSNCLMELFTFLEKHLQEGFLPHYFIKEINLLDHIPSGILTKALDIVSKITCEPQKYITFESKTMCIVRGLYADVSNISLSEDSYSKSNSPINNNNSSSNNNNRNNNSSNSNRNNLMGVSKFESTLKTQNKLLVNRLLHLRLESMWTYSNDKSKIEFCEFIISNMEECIERAGANIDSLHLKMQQNLVTNQKDLSRWKPQFVRYHEALSSGLLEICHLARLYCAGCDVCFQKIPCRSYQYRCSEGCDYDICETCYANSSNNKIDKIDSTTTTATTTTTTTTTTSSNNNNKSTTVSQDLQGTVAPPASAPKHHQHQMKYINDCSKNCYSNIPDQFEKMDMSKYIQEINSLKDEAYILMDQLGMNLGEFCDAYLDCGDIMKDLFAQMFEDRKKDEEHIGGNTDNSAMDEKQSDEQKKIEEAKPANSKANQVKNEEGEQPKEENSDEDEQVKYLQGQCSDIKRILAKIEMLNIMKEACSF